MKTGYQVADIMTTEPVTVPSSTVLTDAAKIMSQSDVNSLLLKDNELLTGILTDEDIVRKAITMGMNPLKTTVKDIAVHDLVTVTPQDDLYEAILLMREHDIRQLPVVDDGKLLGLITMKDILKIEPELFEIMIEKYQIRSARVKSVRKSARAITDGICDECGSFSVKLQEIDDQYLCSKCVHELVEEEA